MFTLNEEKYVQQIIKTELDNIISKILYYDKTVTIGLAGSFSHDEGRIKIINKELKYVDDFDFFLITKSFFKYKKLLKHKEEILKQITVNNCDIWVKWKPLIDLKISSITDYRVLNKNKQSILFNSKWLNKEVESLQYLQASYSHLFKFFITKKKHFLEKSYIELFRSWLFLKNNDYKNNYFKNNLKQLKLFRKEFNNKQYTIMNASLKYRLELSKERINFSSIKIMKELFELMFNYHYKKINIFTIKYYLKFSLYKIKNDEFINPLRNHNKERLIKCDKLIKSITTTINTNQIKKSKELIKIHELKL